MNGLDRARPQKLYCQLLEILQRHIEKGDWEVGSQIPTEEQLCSQYNVSRATVRLAVEELVSSGYLKRLQGRGTYVRRKKPENSIAMLTYAGTNELCPYASCLTRVLDNAALQPPDHVRDHLILADTDRCFCAMRVIGADGSPALLQKLYVPSHLMSRAPDPEILSESTLHICIEELCGARIQRIRELTDIASPGERERAALGMDPGQPALRIQQICLGQGDMPLGYLEVLHRTDAYARTVVFERLKI